MGDYYFIPKKYKENCLSTKDSINSPAIKKFIKEKFKRNNVDMFKPFIIHKINPELNSPSNFGPINREIQYNMQQFILKENYDRQKMKNIVQTDFNILFNNE